MEHPFQTQVEDVLNVTAMDYPNMIPVQYTFEILIHGILSVDRKVIAILT
jgi:hypothetical protein